MCQTIFMGSVQEIVIFVLEVIVPVGVSHDAARQRLAVTELHNAVQAGGNTLVAVRVVDIEVDDRATVAPRIELARLCR